MAATRKYGTFTFSENDAVKLLSRHFVRGPKRINPCIVNQNIDVAVSELDGFLGHFPCTGCIPKIRGNEIRFTACCTNFLNCLSPALRTAPDNYRMDAKLSQFVGCRAADSACSSGDKSGRNTACHVQIPLGLGHDLLESSRRTSVSRRRS